jgi:hypothetical protein
MLNRGKLTALVFAALALFFDAGTALGHTLPVPAGFRVNMQAPAADVPAELARFSGVWTGKWGGLTDTNLIVERVTPTGDVTMVYMLVPAPGQPATAMRRTGKIANNTLTSPIDPSVFPRFEYVMTPAGTLSATYYRANLPPVIGAMQRVP